MKKWPKILSVLLVAALLAGGVAGIVAASGEEESYETVPFETSVELPDGADNPVATLATRLYFSEEEGSLGVGYTLTNRCDLALTRVTFRLTCLDADGNDVYGEPLELWHSFVRDPVQPGEAREFEKRQYFPGAEQVVDFVLEPVLAETELDLAPWTEPQPNNLLLDFCNDPAFSAHFEKLDANPPVNMHLRVDQSVDEDITDLDAMLEEIESLRNMRIGEETDIVYCDRGISYWFTMADGTEWGVSFNAPGIFCWHNKNYEILHD